MIQQKKLTFFVNLLRTRIVFESMSNKNVTVNKSQANKTYRI